MITQTRKTKQRWDNYKRCRLFTEIFDYSLNFDSDYEEHEMIAVVMETYKLDKSEIIGIEITKCKFLCVD